MHQDEPLRGHDDVEHTYTYIKAVCDKLSGTRWRYEVHWGYIWFSDIACTYIYRQCTQKRKGAQLTGMNTINMYTLWDIVEHISLTHSTPQVGYTLSPTRFYTFNHHRYMHNLYILFTMYTLYYHSYTYFYTFYHHKYAYVYTPLNIFTIHLVTFHYW